jgi:hypothetical protein
MLDYSHFSPNKTNNGVTSDGVGSILLMAVKAMSKD